MQHDYHADAHSMLTLGEGLPGVQVQGFQVQLAGLVHIPSLELQLGPGVPAGHRLGLHLSRLLQHVSGQVHVPLTGLRQRPALHSTSKLLQCWNGHCRRTSCTCGVKDDMQYGL